MSVVQPVTFLVPPSSREPIELRVAHSGLRMVLVSRESIHLLDTTWKVLGVYVLLGPADDPDHYRAYVGEVGKASLIARAKHHAKRKDWWNRAVLIASAGDGFISAEIGWLEGRLYDVLNNALACVVMNGNRPGDESLPAHERAVLERYVEPIIAALRACGAAPDTADQIPEPKGRRTIARHPEKVTDLLAAGLLKPGTVLHPLRKGVDGTATVLPDGRLQAGDALYDSLSSAARGVSGTVSEAGWDFWGAPSGDGGFVPLARLRARVRDRGSTEETTTPGDRAGRLDRRGERHVEPDVGTFDSDAVPSPERTLVELVTARGLHLPLALHAYYRGQRSEAALQKDGSIVFQGERFTSPSKAGSVARRSSGYRGTGHAATNGWIFWRFVDSDGMERPLASLRTVIEPEADPTTLPADESAVDGRAQGGPLHEHDT